MNTKPSDRDVAYNAILQRSQETVSLAKANGVIIAAAESCTGGLLMASLTQIAGSSAILDRGFVTYSNQSKIDLLGVSASLMEEYGAVSEPVAQAMAKGALSKSDADIAVSITGIAGPGGGTKEKPVGSVCFGFAYYADHGDEIISKHIVKHFTPPLVVPPASPLGSPHICVQESSQNQIDEGAGRLFVREESVLFALELICDHCTG